jgi:hypothetical protein
MNARSQISEAVRLVACVADEFIAGGRLSDPADGLDDDEAEQAFWDEVERRLDEAGLVLE